MNVSKIYAGVEWLDSLGREEEDHEAVMEWYRQPCEDARYYDPFPNKDTKHEL